MFRKAIIGITLSAMLGGSFAASLPRVNIAVNAQAQSIKPTENTITYNYNGDTPLKLTGYINSVAAYNEGVSNLQYNAQNEIIRDDHGNALDYDALGAMIEFTNVQSSVEVQYQYDAESHQSVESTFNNKGEVQTRESFYYSTGDKAEMLAESDRDGNQLSYLFAEEKIGSINNSDEANLYITDQAGSVVALVSNSQLSHEYVYSPYGIETDLDQSTTKAKNAQGFDGERTDKATGYQFLGNGYRAYNPILHRFMQMDDISYSPFGKGGINGYVFGNNNPIMNFDPSGHWGVLDTFNVILFGLSLLTLDPFGIMASTPPLVRSIVHNAAHKPEGWIGNAFNLLFSLVGTIALGIGIYGAIRESGSIIVGLTAEEEGEESTYDTLRLNGAVYCEDLESNGKVTMQYVSDQNVDDLPEGLRAVINNGHYENPITYDKLGEKDYFGTVHFKGGRLLKSWVTANKTGNYGTVYNIYDKDSVKEMLRDRVEFVDPVSKIEVINMSKPLAGTRYRYIPSYNFTRLEQVDMEDEDDFSPSAFFIPSALSSVIWGMISYYR
ncbi:MAG: RHS repeat-associated core domain-containing protein [Proteobacteria bacterium]|nr:RHS repeat-associated core domain-containing protein [Pseudomonadota bacterium]